MTELPQGPTTGARRRRALTIVMAVFVLVGLGWVSWWYVESRGHETTDNAYVGGNLVQVTPQVGGTVLAIGADDTDLVDAGQTLVQLDTADSKVALQRAEAQLAQAVRSARVLYAKDTALAAEVAQRKVDLDRAERDLARRAPLIKSGAVSQEDLQHARDAVAVARAALETTREQLAASRALTQGVDVRQQPSVLSAAAKVREAYLALQRDRIPAPVTGYVAKRAVQVGQRVAPGTPLMAVVPLNEVWVDANFKEVQLRNMRIGQPVTLTADMYGSGVVYDGRVAGLSAGTGGAFALLPPQNATGNWIKVVQRLPVRIVLEKKQLAAHPLRIGLSMEVNVDVRDTNGPQLAKSPAKGPVYATKAFDEQAAAADARVTEIIDANLGKGK